MTITRLSAATAVAAALFGTATKTQAQYAPANPSQDHYAYAFDYGGKPFYMSVDLGGTVVQSTKVRNFPGWALSFDPGIRADFTFGYHIPNTLLAVEFESGYMRNSLTSNGFLTSFNQEANLFQVPFVANLVFNLPINDKLSLYVGAGAGGVGSQMDVSKNDTHVRDTDFTFAYQGKAGVKYVVAQDIEVGLGYEFMGTLSHSWFNDDPLLVTSTDPIYTHSFLASFTFRF